MNCNEEADGRWSPLKKGTHKRRQMVTLRFREKSKFTYKNLLDLNDKNKAYNSPLAVICHIDLNAFFAQCEQLRLGLSQQDPVVCVQWQSLIAVSYAARDYGISRMDRLNEAKLKCPNLIPAHTAVFKKGEPSWKYVDYVPSPVNHKVSLDPYRREGKKVLNIFRSECDLVEKASVDESFMDLGRLVFQKIMTLFPDLLEGMENLSDNLKPISVLPDGLEFQGYIIKKNNTEEDESSIVDDEHQYLIEDWDDIVMLIGSMICFDLRKKVEDNLGYKTSGGIGRVKTIAKLASGFKKPDQQTIVRNDAIPSFVKYFKLTDFWSLGGKIGKWINENLDNDASITTVRDTYSTVSELAKVLDKNYELAEKIYCMVRGTYAVPLEEKEFLKSMASNKNFRDNCVSKRSDLIPWIKVFIGELRLRIQESDEEYNTISRATKMTLSILSFSKVRHSKQCTLGQSPKDHDLLQQMYYNTAIDLLDGLEALWKEESTTKMYPIINASLSISNFVDNSGVSTLDDLITNVKKRKIDQTEENSTIKQEKPTTEVIKKRTFLDNFLHNKQPSDTDSPVKNIGGKCGKCGEIIEDSLWQTHQDYHIALDLEHKFNKGFEESYGDILLKQKNRKKLKSKHTTIDKNQRTLPF